jgi:predicted AAA+ superfamily ATPase
LLFGDEMRAVPRATRVVVGEVQRWPTLLNEVHRQIEERHLRVVLLGSSARKRIFHGQTINVAWIARDAGTGRMTVAGYLDILDDIYYWLPTQARRTEVDFLLARGTELLALEVKASRHFSRSCLSGLKAIGELDRGGRRVTVYQGSERSRTDKSIEAWPLELLLEQLEAGSSWP